MKINNKLHNLPTTELMIKSYNLVANKKLGQNFILDSNITDNIVLAAGNLENKTVLEIGPGPGGLTRSLLATNLNKLIAVEFDSKCIVLLKQIANLDDRLNIINSNALTINEANFASNNKLTIISNLPFNIGTALLIKWLNKIDLFEQILIMLQKEVVERIIASSGNKAYGRLSIMCQTICDCEMVLEVPSSCFHPAPKVDSAIVRLIPKENNNINRNLLEKISAHAFNQRRKKIRSSLKQLLKDEDFDNLNIDPNLRAEDLTLKQFHQITSYIEQNE